MDSPLPRPNLSNQHFIFVDPYPANPELFSLPTQPQLYAHCSMVNIQWPDNQNLKSQCLQEEGYKVTQSHFVTSLLQALALGFPLPRLEGLIHRSQNGVGVSPPAQKWPTDILIFFGLRYRQGLKMYQKNKR